MTETMLTRMARAMAERDSPYRPGTHNAERWWIDMDEDEKDRFIDTARAAVVLMLEPTAQMVRAATESVAEDGEGGEFAPLFELLDFSGENKTRLVVTQALKASAAAILNEKPILQGEA